MKHVVLLTNAHEAPATALADVLHGAGVAAFIEGIREEVIAPAPVEQAAEAGSEDVTPPLAVLYEVVPGADMRELYSVIEHAVAVWPNAPLVACRRPIQVTSLQRCERRTLRRSNVWAFAPSQMNRRNFRRCCANWKIAA